MRKLLALGLVALVASAASAAIIDEDFESYADTAAMEAVWAPGVGTLDTGFGLSGTQSMAHPAGTTNKFTLGADLIPSDAAPVVLSGAIYDDAAGNKRFTIGMRSLNTFPLFEMGMYNSIAGENYYYRVTLFPGANPSWTPMPGGLGHVVGWHTFEATFTGSDITVTLDLNSDSSVDSTANIPLGDVYGVDGLGVVRLGGPSDLSSAGGGGNFDDIYLDQVPEPTSLALLALGGLALIRRR